MEQPRAHRQRRDLPAIPCRAQRLVGEEDHGHRKDDLGGSRRKSQAQHRAEPYRDDLSRREGRHEADAAPQTTQ